MASESILSQVTPQSAAALVNLDTNVRALLVLGLEAMDPRDWRTQRDREILHAVIAGLEAGSSVLRKKFGDQLGTSAPGARAPQYSQDEEIRRRARLIEFDDETPVDRAAASRTLGRKWEPHPGYVEHPSIELRAAGRFRVTRSDMYGNRPPCDNCRDYPTGGDRCARCGWTVKTKALWDAQKSRGGLRTLTALRPVEIMPA